MFNAYMEKCVQISESVAMGVSIVDKDIPIDEETLCETIRNDLAKAFAITQTKSDCNSLLRDYIERSPKICSRMVTNHKAMQYVIPLLNSILVLCDMPSKPGSSKSSLLLNTINSAKHNINLTLSYVYQELGQYENSLHCIQNIETQSVTKSLTDMQQQAMTYNKFYTCCKSKNVVEARKALSSGFDYKSNPYSVMLEMVLLFISISLESNYTDCNNIFKQLCEQYPA